MAETTDLTKVVLLAWDKVLECQPSILPLTSSIISEKVVVLDLLNRRVSPKCLVVARCSRTFTKQNI
jgi:hypothetical protein